MPVSQEQLETRLRTGLEPIFMKVEDFSDGCGAKYNILVVSAKFVGQSLLQRQRLVNEVLIEEMTQIHALTQKCCTPEQWEKMIKEQPDLVEQQSVDGAAAAKCIGHSH